MTAEQYDKYEKEKEAREDAFFDKQYEKAIENNELVVTKRGVYKNLNKTPYVIEISDSNHSKILRFSSQAKLNKFEAEMQRKKIQLDASFKRIYGQDYNKQEKNFDGLVYSMYVGNYNKLKLR